MQTTLHAPALPFKAPATYLIASLFIIGNIVLPQIAHLIPQGGMTWLPIYFFTLVGAYLYGWRVGLITAVASPIINSLVFGMPATAALPAIMLKSVLLAAFAGIAMARYRKVNIALLIAVVIGYQSTGTFGEWALCGDFMEACQDFRIGIPGMLLQIIGGYCAIRLLNSRSNHSAIS